MKKNHTIRQLYTRKVDAKIDNELFEQQKHNGDISLQMINYNTHQESNRKKLKNHMELADHRHRSDFKEQTKKKKQYLKKRFNFHGGKLKKIAPALRTKDAPGDSKAITFLTTGEHEYKYDVHENGRHEPLLYKKNMQKSFSLPQINSDSINNMKQNDRIKDGLLSTSDHDDNSKNVNNNTLVGDELFTPENTISLDEAFQIPLHRSRKSRELERIERMKKGKRKRSRQSRSKIRSRLGTWTPYTPGTPLEDTAGDQMLLQIG